ncbi:putative U3 small nucleolar ribonucleoprotein MPP10 [Trypanosoma cruzi]|uniref:U3 small nucleolar ribonucleoprotein protein MPP10, putative n=2 Tax=Trypanosoma cruzi TaxID=5693 RepID=Q4DW90_TRYCC|nr:U3 small nucleolar ribonucleoprotein protein MPP10, putative [Trypanosoma cruzi]EAN96799.1 U3 small nucleolar ribonucleoprotein protein MPP10, putative [Trypanosoma cruzi]PWV12919.1 putative U3 small nucleolar ribonucleoprotein MPP10 [Trypanosoma cruzi]|eukprot:XP_818650.1 U3 small nucleolar ribonucleoprotein protein MPP10 [Trypanosoma cruzi strain CL Brener]
MATTKKDAALPRKLKGSVGTLQQALDNGLDHFFSSRKAGEETSRQCLSSLFVLASSLHTPRLPYYKKSLETSAARHVTVEQIWGQLSMLLRPVLRRLQDNVRRLQKTVNASSASQKRGSTRVQTKRPRDDVNVDDSDALEEGKDVLSTRNSQLSESDLDEEIAQLLVEQQQQRRKLAKPASTNGHNGDDLWRYALGKGDGDGNDENGDADVDGEGDDDEDSNSDLARIRRRHARAMAGADDDDDNEEEEEDERAVEELAAMKEMYGEDFVPDEDDDDGAEDDDDDPHFEEDLAWDDPTAVFKESDGMYFGNEDILAGDGAQEEHQQHERGDAVGENDDDDAELNDPSLTMLQRERQRERRLVERLEQERLYSTQWAMSGETSGNQRPRDALLDEELDFEHAMKAVPVITEAVTAKLEDRIRRRILCANYDDVQRRTSLSAPGDLVTTRRDATIDSEKSKLSLMDLYEKEYLERARALEEASGDAAQSAEPLTEIERDELRAIQMWRRLAQHLDALSNFYYTPKPIQEELAARVRAVDGQAPAIALETVGNFATTREAALAPQDLYRSADRKYADVGINELVPRERRALRRAKKEQAKAASDRKEKRAAQAKKKKQQLPEPQ